MCVNQLPEKAYIRCPQECVLGPDHSIREGFFRGVQSTEVLWLRVCQFEGFVVKMSPGVCGLALGSNP